MSKRKLFLKELKVLFIGWSLLFHLLFLFILNGFFFYYVSKSIVFGVITGFVGMIFFFYVFTFKNRRLKRHQENLNDLMKYVTNVSFFMQSGENVPYALRSALKTVGPDIQKDIQKTIDKIDEHAVLETDHFKKYEFTSLDQFHQNLLIKYEHGGEKNSLFTQIQQNMLFELKKRDELYRKRKGFAMSVYTLLGMVAMMMVMLSLFVPELWDIFLGVSLGSIFVLSGTYILILINLAMLQKHNIDISVKL